VDGNDVEAVFTTSREAVRLCRAGDGPVIIEAKTMRMRGHAQHDPAEYVPKEMFEHWKRRDPIDFIGLGTVALGVGLLEFTLDKGQEKDWFGSGEIQFTAMFAVATLIFFVFWEWRHPDPIVDLKLLKNRNFGTAVFLQLILGMVLFGSTVLIPQYLQTLLGYTAERAGMVLSPGALAILLLMPIVGTLIGKVEARWLAGVGFAISALALFHMCGLSLQIDFKTAMTYRIYQSIGLAFLFIPINTAATDRRYSISTSTLERF